MRLVRVLGALLALTLPLAAGGNMERGIELYQAGKYAEAAAQLRAVVDAEPDNARAHRFLGLAFLHQEKNAEAGEHLRKALELEPSGENRTALALFHIEEKAYPAADALLAEGGGDEFLYARGLLRFHQQRFADSARDLEEFLKQSPGHAYAHYYAGLAYNGLKRPDRMLSHFEIFIRLKPDAPEARKVRAVLKTGR